MTAAAATAFTNSATSSTEFLRSKFRTPATATNRYN
jgi:hypothetical protein